MLSVTDTSGTALRTTLPLSPAVVVAAMMLMSLAHMLQAIKLDGVLKDNTIYFIRTQEVIVIIRLHNLL